MHKIMAMPWDRTVASAAPNVPSWNFMMNRRSRPLLRNAENKRKNKGILLLPMALIREAQ